MPKSSLVLVLVAVLLTGLVVPTGASGADQLWVEPAVVLAPHPGPNGQYAGFDAAGELVVDLSSPGVNADAVTRFDDVFTATNTDNASVAVWFTHAEPAAVVLAVDGRPATSETRAVVLAPGEQVSVDVTVDSSARVPGEVVLAGFAVHAAEPAALPTPTDPDASSPAPADERAPVTPTADLPPPSGEDEVVFADGTDPRVRIRSLPADAAADLPGRDGPPRPVVDAASAPRRLVDDGAVRPTAGDAAVVDVGVALALSADRTTFGDVEAVQPDGRVARLVDVDVPADREARPAYVRLAVDRARLGGADPTAARIGRHVDDGWQLLDTSVVLADDRRVVLQARTPGFGPFAVFPDPAVGYAWELPGGRTAEPSTVVAGFDEPGPRAVTLAVTDARGRTATTGYRLLANDRPAVAVEAPATIAPGEPVRLRAVVTDRVGDATVTWRFADGSTTVGPSVERSFATGEHVVRVTVTDAYGATVRESATLVVGEPAGDGRVRVDLFQLSLALEQRLAYAAAGIFLLVAGLREWAARRRRVRAR